MKSNARVSIACSVPLLKTSSSVHDNVGTCATKAFVASFFVVLLEFLRFARIADWQSSLNDRNSLKNTEGVFMCVQDRTRSHCIIGPNCGAFSFQVQWGSMVCAVSKR